VAYTPGPFGLTHGLIQWGGSLPGNETWSCSIRVIPRQELPVGTFDGTAEADNWVMDELIDHYVLAIKAYHNNPLVPISSRCNLQFVKFNRINMDGRYRDAVTNERTFADWPGYITTGHPANQVAWAVTLATEVKRGPASKGRFYLPMPCSPVQPDGLVTQTVAQDLRAQTKTFLEALADVPGFDVPADPTPAVMSRKAGAPMQRVITGVSVGRVLDTQRRRRRSLLELPEAVQVDFGSY